MAILRRKPEGRVLIQSDQGIQYTCGDWKKFAKGNNGGETVITHLADILTIQAIRSWIDSAPQADRGWLTALRDDQRGKALAAIHREPEKNGSVAKFTKGVGMSRSGFSARFTHLVGDSVIHYLTQWRMQRVRAQLLEMSDPLSILSERPGYQSEDAFAGYSNGCLAYQR